MNTIALYVGWIVILFIIAFLIWQFPFWLKHSWHSIIYTRRLWVAVKMKATVRGFLQAIWYCILLIVGWEGAPSYAVAQDGATAYWPGNEPEPEQDYHEFD